MVVYLTGAKYQFGAFYVNSDFDGLYIVQHNQKTVSILWKPNVKPQIIDQMGEKAIAGNLAPCDLEKLRKLEEDYILFLRNNKPKNLFKLKTLSVGNLF